MQYGVTMFMTDLTMGPVELAREIEARGLRSLFVPEHTHIPTSRRTRPPTGDAELRDEYKRTLDPFVALAMAAAATERLIVGTGICLVAQRDPIITAKEVATLDHLSGGRVTLGVGFGWNATEMRDHGVDAGRRWAVVREHMAAMEALWSSEQAEFHGEFVDFGRSWAWPKPVQQPRVRTLVGGGARESVFAAVVTYADGWLPIGGGGLGEAMPRLRARAEQAGRDPASLAVVPFGTIPDEGKLEHYARLGIDEVVLRLRAGDEVAVRGQLDALAPLVEFAATLGPP